MCIICIEMDKRRLSPWEAKRNLGEMTEKIGLEHAKEVEAKIYDLILEEYSFQEQEICDFCTETPCTCHWGSYE